MPPAQRSRPSTGLLRLVWVLAALLGSAGLTAADNLAAGPFELGRPFVRVFTESDYRQPATVASFAEDQAGVAYFGDRHGILRFNGQEWTTLPLPHAGVIRGLVTGPDDRLWIGGFNELGCFENDARGVRTYGSLTGRLPEAERNFQQIDRIYPLAHGVYFVAGDRLLRWHEGKFTVLRTGPLTTWPIDGGFAVWREGADRVETWDGSAWRTLFTDPTIGTHRVKFVGSLPDGWMIAFEGYNLYHWSAAGGLQHVATGFSEVIRDRQIDHGVRLGDGTFVLSFVHGGLIQLEAGGRLRQLFALGEKNQPAAFSTVLGQDGSGGLWVSSTAGLFRFAFGPATTFAQARNMGNRSAHALVRHGGRLYAGTRDGLFVLEPAAIGGTQAQPARWRELPGYTSVQALASTPDQLLVGANGTLLTFRDRPGRMLAEKTGDPLCLLVPASLPGTVLVATDTGLFRETLANPGTATPTAGTPGGITRLVETPTGDIWAAGPAGFMRLRPDAPPEFFDQHHGLASAAGSSLALAGEGPVFLAGDRLHRFDERAARFIPCEALNAELDRRQATQVAVFSSGPEQLWLEFTPGSESGRRVIALAGFSGNIRVLPARVTDATGGLLTVLEEPAPAGRIIWLGGTKAVLRIEAPAVFAPAPGFTVRLDRVADAQGALLSPLGRARLPFAGSRLDFRFATRRFDDASLRFETQLDEGAWSAPSPVATHTLERLPPGRHLLAVRAVDADGHRSTPAEYPFTILRPWWRSWWAMAAYTAAAAAGIYALVRWRVRAVRQRNLELEALITDRTRELRAAKSAAEAANRAKSAFLANMSHELRTPLNAILGFAQILRRAPNVPDEHQRRLGVITRNGDHLLAMINEILDLSKIEAGKLHLAAGPFPLPRLLHGLADTFAQRAAERGLAFYARIAPELPAVVSGDEAKLRQVLINLLGNAIKFTERGSVTLEAGRRPADGAVWFAVRDTGIGIAARDIAGIFEPFQQVADSPLSVQGTGLGLTISQRLVQLMGSQITAQSAPGAGSTFSFAVALPVANEPAAEPRTRPVNGYTGRRRHLLVIDDEPANRDVLCGLLEPLGFSLAEAETGAAGLAAFAERPADAVLLDLRMPGGLDGFETARRLRAMPGGAATRIVAVSASVFEADRQFAIDAGCDEFLPKPFEAERLFATLGRLLGLEWVHPDNLPAAAATDPAPAPLPAAAIEPLLECVRRGDLKSFRERLAQVAAQHPECAATTTRLDALAAEFQLGRLRQELRPPAVSSPS